MTNYSFGDVILVPFPFTDQTTTKKRPAVVISSEVYNREYPDLIIIAIMSQRKSIAMVGDVTLTKWQESGLIKPSMIKPIIATLENKLVLRKLGQLQSPDRDALQQGLKGILDI